ncbi:MAG: sorbosone dehydrogenase family protein [Xanthomonadales bacterium]|nr:sorbosone dehydrogenase family protein [Xanthomonadales bacterium]
MKAIILALLAVAVWLVSASAHAKVRLDQIRLPDGFSISVFADDVDNARAMAMGDQGTLFVGSRRRGNVYAVVDRDGDFKADQVYTIARGLELPSGIAFRDGTLYIGAVSTIYRMDDIENRLDNPPEPVVVTDQFPSDRHHGWKYLGFGADGKLYVPVGAPCNICLEPGYAEIKRMNPDGTGIETFARGVRNSVGFDWHPETGELWFTDNGRDMLGDDLPPCELNHAPRQGMHFGYPFCHGDDVSDPEFGEQRACSEFTQPAQNLGPHTAPLGMRFYTGDMFPAEYRNQAFIAEHGSWNRSKKIGYRVMLVRLENNRAVSYEPFAEGWLQGEKDWGRPVDILILADGSMLVSDDKAGVIYRIRYDGKPAGS